ncbi:MAG: hypothetical protein K2G89_08540 [Lachnospiraceae bacterium]|nr:hypothetical protein [Lachnospiraceae bacterium]
MPSINRIRVNNVKYNFGTQQYDDFVMRMYGKNTLYDLANGGGKSVLMLLLLQNLIPNCTLDEKQPIEKLFRNGGGNSVIHSLIEWRLDDDEVSEGYRYMTTGFCARKAKDEVDGQAGSGASVKKDTASIEYFNYSIMYREYNKNDIVNLPLSYNKERISFSGLRTYLKDLARKDFNLKVQVFDRKGEYQRFISGYGLYESHWEIIRGINKTEGHVRTYFESNYRTTRKVVEDLLIEEIIEKAYLVKTEQNEDSGDMAKNLMDIKDKLVELSKKKRDIANYDRQMELLHVLIGRVSSFLTLFEQRSKMTATIANVYATGKAIIQEDELKLESLEKQKQEKLAEKESRKKDLESLRIRKLEFEKQVLMEDIEGLVRAVGQNKSDYIEAENELKFKESINDYMDYKKDAASRHENEMMLKTAVASSKSDISTLRQLAYTKKVRTEQQALIYQQNLSVEKARLEKLDRQLEEETEQLRQAEIGLEIARNDVQHTKTEARDLLTTVGNLKADINLLMLADAEERMEANEKEVAQKQAEIENLEMKCSERTKEYYEKLHQQDKLAMEVAECQAELDRLQEKLDLYLHNAERIQNMMRVYNVAHQSELLAAINKRCMQCIVDVTNRQEELKALAKRRQGLNEDRVIGETASVNKVKEYIETRHSENVVLGMDYIAARNAAQREQLLSMFPLLPYGVVVKNFDFLRTDDAIYELQLGDYAVPVFSEAVLYNPMGRNRDDSVVFISKNSRHFTDEKLLEQERLRLDGQIKELEDTIRHLMEIGLTYEEDMEYISSLGSEVSMSTMDAANEKKTEKIELEKQLDALKDVCHDMLLEIEQDEALLKEAHHHMEHLRNMEKNLVAVKVVSDRIRQLETVRTASEAEIKRLAELQISLKKSTEDLILRREDIGNRIHGLEEAGKALQTEWETVYQDYYMEGDYEEAALSDEDLTAAFKAAKSVYEKENIVLADKKKLIEALKMSMERAKRAIEKRGVSMDVLRQMDEEHSIYMVGERIITKLSMQVAKLSTDGAMLQNELEQKRSVLHRLEGNIEQSVRQLEERYGEYTQLSVSAEEIDGAIAQGDKVLKTIDQEYKETVAAFDRAVKQHNSMMELYKDVKRIMKVNNISPRDAVIIHETEAKMRNLFEESLLAYDKSEKALEKAKADLLKYKSHTAETLYSMNAFELSETIGRDIEVPEDYQSATLLLENLNSMISFIELEKDRVTKGIQDMEFIKNNFENQCIQRCKNVKTELDKLPKLSRIMVGGEPVQMVGLVIPYVKDEHMRQRMSEYIDDVVSGADQYEDAKERMKYIRNRLVLKRLFSVIVTDMNAIKLTLYKRERIKEQSRYLRYEEAVGSTGQSQGIYIQFLISVINYISGMYGANIDDDKRRKTIFIDNPFGAAKDIYIWEPIFALLKANNVQLIVPARGATPAITARFDVNYTLGQKLVGSKQQTVVIDYESRIEQEEIEYKELSYEQASFDFI